MAHILIACWGSHGDVDPYIGLGVGLQARGCAVTIATVPYYRALITGSGLGFLPIRPDVNPHDDEVMARIMDRRGGSRFVTRDLVYPATEAMYADLEPGAAAADLIISHPLTAPAAIHAERLGKPWLSTLLAPMSFFSESEPPVFPPAPWLKPLEKLSQWPSRWFVRMGRRVARTWPEPVHALRQRLNLPDRGSPLFEGQHSPHGVLALWSKVLGDPQPDWPRKVTITGHMFYDASHGLELEPEVEAFLGEGEAPIVFTLGSSAVFTSGDFWRTSLDAVLQLGRRAVFLVGHGRAASLREALPPEVLAVDKTPHSLIMPRAAVVVHQCGIGTLGQGLRCGRPVLAVPFAHDQYDNAWRLTRLGVAISVPAPSYSTSRAKNALERLLADPRYVESAARVAETVRSERGVAAACDAVLSTLAKHTSCPMEVSS